MGTTFDLPEEIEGSLHLLAHKLDLTDQQAVEAMMYVFFAVFQFERNDWFLSRSLKREYQELWARFAERAAQLQVPPIQSAPNVLGGDARIRNTRIPVWLLVAHKKWGESDSEILAQYPTLNAADLTAAWDYYTANTERIDAERRANEDED